MKFILCLLFVLVFICCKKQIHTKNKYHIIGTIQNLPDNATVYLSNNNFIDSTISKKGKFRFEGRVENPERVLFTIKEGKTSEWFWLENDTIEITGTYNGDATFKIFGGENQIISNKLFDRTKIIISKKKELSDLISSTHDINKKDSLYELNKILTSQLIKVEKQILKENLNSFHAVKLLNKYKRTWNKDSVKTLFTSMSVEIQKAKDGNSINRYLKLSKHPQIGEQFVDFQSQNINDEIISLSQVTSKYTLVDFWASWCVPCRKENPNLVKLYNRFKSKGFTIVGVSLDMRKDRWLSAISKDKLPWYNLNDLEGPDGEAAIIYDVRDIPDNLLLDKNGIIVGRNLNTENLQDILLDSL